MTDAELEFKLLGIHNYVIWFKEVHNINISHAYENYNEVLINYKKDGMNYMNKIECIIKYENKNKLIYELLDKAIKIAFTLI